MKLLSGPTTRRQQWLGFVLSPVAWTVYFVVVYVLNEAACRLPLLPPAAFFPLATLFTVLTLGLIGLAAWWAWRALREGDGAGNGRFLGLSGLFMCGLFVVMTTAVWVAALVLLPC
ncbi:MAG: hypothetical protein IPM53_15375 [Anaerolineaceae bacterium]|nr:hypothetical protein [Anaerolineaceae bacterium]